MLHDVFPDLVVQPEVGADDGTGDQDNRRAADDGLLRGPLDLLELAVGLLDEDPRAEAVLLVLVRAPRASSTPAAPAARLRRVAVRGRPGGSARRRASCESRFLLRAPRAPLLTRL